MNIRAIFSIVLAVVVLALPQLGSAACPTPTPPLLIDNFATGKYSTSLRTGANRGLQTGTMAGGRRYTYFSVCDPLVAGACASTNRYNQLATFEIPATQSVLAVSSGVRVFDRLEVFYGYNLVNGQVISAPLNRDLSCYSKFRVTFGVNDLTVNFNMQVVAGNNPTPAQCGLNQVGRTTGFTVDFPFSCFVPNAGAAPNFADIDVIDLILQSGSAVGSNDFAITRIEALP